MAVVIILKYILLDLFYRFQTEQMYSGKCKVPFIYFVNAGNNKIYEELSSPICLTLNISNIS